MSVTDRQRSMLNIQSLSGGGVKLSTGASVSPSYCRHVAA